MTRASEKKKEWMALLGALEIGDIDLAHRIATEHGFNCEKVREETEIPTKQTAEPIKRKKYIRRSGIYNVKITGVNSTVVVVEDFEAAAKLLGTTANTARICCYRYRKHRGASVSYTKDTLTDLSKVDKRRIYELVGSENKTSCGGIKVKVTDLNGNEMIFKSISQAAKWTNVAKSRVYIQVGTKEPYKGLYYEFVEG